MSFELLHFSHGGAEPLISVSSIEIDEAIRCARHLFADDDPLGVVEVRENGQTVFTLGRGWTSAAVERSAVSPPPYAR